MPRTAATNLERVSVLRQLSGQLSDARADFVVFLQENIHAETLTLRSARLLNGVVLLLVLAEFAAEVVQLLVDVPLLARNLLHQRFQLRAEATDKWPSSFPLCKPVARYDRAVSWLPGSRL